MNAMFSSKIMKRRALKRGAIVSLLVGSLLILINHGPIFANGHMPALWQVALTYLVPFLVSTISSAMAESDRYTNRGNQVFPHS